MTQKHRDTEARRPMLHEEVTQAILGCAIAVHRELGPGLREHSYQTALSLEMRANDLAFEREPSISVFYRGVLVGAHRPDFIVANKVVVEVKSALGFDAVFARQVLTYLRACQLNVGLLINFNCSTMRTGVRRFVLT